MRIISFLIVAFLLPSYSWVFQEPSIKNYRFSRSELTQQELELIRGIGPSLSAKLKKEPDLPLLEVKGIGVVKAQYFRSYLLE